MFAALPPKNAAFAEFILPLNNAELPGSGNESKVFKMEKTGSYQVVYSFGWYLRKFIMDMILQNDKPEDFVIATGEQHSVREFCQLAFRYAGIELCFEGEGENEKGIDCKTGKVLVEVSPDFYRPTDVVNLWGDPSKAKRELGWNPQKTSFEQLVKIMVDADIAKVAVERASQQVRTNLAEYLEKGIVK